VPPHQWRDLIKNAEHDNGDVQKLFCLLCRTAQTFESAKLKCFAEQTITHQLLMRLLANSLQMLNDIENNDIENDRCMLSDMEND